MNPKRTTKWTLTRRVVDSQTCNVAWWVTSPYNFSVMRKALSRVQFPVINIMLALNAPEEFEYHYIFFSSQYGVAQKAIDTMTRVDILS